MLNILLLATEHRPDAVARASPKESGAINVTLTADHETNALSFYLWDAAVPALPVIAQLLLAAFLAIGGYRRYLRR